MLDLFKALSAFIVVFRISDGIIKKATSRKITVITESFQNGKRVVSRGGYKFYSVFLILHTEE